MGLYDGSKSVSEIWDGGKSVSAVYDGMEIVWPARALPRGPIRHVSLSELGSGVVFEDGRLWTAGHDVEHWPGAWGGHLARYHNPDVFVGPALIDNVKKSHHGLTGVLIEKNDGTLWAAGFSQYGELCYNLPNFSGVGGDIYWVRPGLVLSEVASDIAHVYYSHCSTRIVKNNGNLWATGSDLGLWCYGMGGMGIGNPRDSKVARSTLFADYRVIQCKEDLLLTEGGIIARPISNWLDEGIVEELPALPGIVEFCSEATTSDLTRGVLARTSDGDLYCCPVLGSKKYELDSGDVWGWEWGNWRLVRSGVRRLCGHGRLPHPDSSAFNDTCFTFIVTNDGQVLSRGHNQYGQLCRNTSSVVDGSFGAVPGINNAKAVYVNSWHMAAIVTEDDELYTAGYVSANPEHSWPHLFRPGAVSGTHNQTNFGIVPRD